MSRSEALEAVAEAARPWTVEFKASEHMRLFDLGEPWFRIELYISRPGMRGLGYGGGQLWLRRYVNTADLRRAAEAASEALNGLREEDGLSPLALDMLRAVSSAAKAADETEAKERARLDATPAPQCTRCGGTGQAPAIRGSRFVPGETMWCPGCNGGERDATPAPAAPDPLNVRTLKRALSVVERSLSDSTCCNKNITITSLARLIHEAEQAAPSTSTPPTDEELLLDYVREIYANEGPPEHWLCDKADDAARYAHGRALLKVAREQREAGYAACVARLRELQAEALAHGNDSEAFGIELAADALESER